MCKKILKILFITVTLLYQLNAQSKTLEESEYNRRYLSNYFSALLSYNKQENIEALKYFESSKPLIKKHEKYLKKYIFSLVGSGKVSKAIKQIKHFKSHKNSNFFEAKILLLIDSLEKENYKNSEKEISLMEFFQNEGNYEIIIYETLKNYIELFQNKKINYKNNNKYGRLSQITNAFQNCYLDTDKTKSLFINLVNANEGDYSRYLFFYLQKILEDNDYQTAKQISSRIDPITNGLLIVQTKNWIESSDFNKFKDLFSCKNEKHLLSEFFFLIANLYSAEEDYIKSNFYLNISNYLNPKFYFNLSLQVENYFITGNYNASKNILESFKYNDTIYNWFKIKRAGKIIAKQQNENKSLNFIENKFKKIKNPSTKILFEMANIYKRHKKYEKAIDLYTATLELLDENTDSYAETLYRRGGSYERIKKYSESDKDLLNSLKIVPGDPYVTNYLAYSWLERNYKIEEALVMLEDAYNQKKNDPYIIDSIGWAYFLIKDYEQAAKYLIQAVEIMPNDPIVNDHYGDILWMLNKKIQARYFWKNVLTLDETEEEMKKNVKKKLLNGINKI